MRGRGRLRRVRVARGERGTSLVELLVASVLGLGVVLASIQLLRSHARLALQVQAELSATRDVAWTLARILREVREAGADPRRTGIPAFASAEPHRMTILRDLDGDGAIDERSAEISAVAWSERNGGTVSHRAGAQAMSLLEDLPKGAFRLRYFDGLGRASDGSMASDIQRVEVSIDAQQALGPFVGRASLVDAAAVRVRGEVD